jgi:hypothetical protein
MKRLLVVLLLVAAPFVPSIDQGARREVAQAQDVTAKEAFEAAKQLGTVEAWKAFLASYPSGFYADLARAYIKKLGGSDARPATAAPSSAPPAPSPAPTAAPRPAPPPPVTAVRPAAGAAQPASETALPPNSAPRAVTVARTTEIPRCSSFVDAAAPARGDGTTHRPHRTIAAAIAAVSSGAVICVAEGTYPEQLKPGEKYVTLAGGFQRDKGFTVRDSARFVSKATGRGGSFIRYDDPAPTGNQLTAIDGFEISGYSQAIVRDFYKPQRFDITNNHIHDNTCADMKLAGGGFALSNVVGQIAGNVFRNNSCGRGGAGFLNETVKQNNVTIARNLIDNNSGLEPDSSHGGAIYVFGKTLRITANLFTRNRVTNWGAGLYVGAWVEGGQETTASLSWNVYRDNRAGVAGGGMFCDDGATCISDHEIYDRNCGSNIYLDAGGPTPTTARFRHLTNVRALDVDCKAPGAGVRIDRDGEKEIADTYSFVDAIFWQNAPGLDFAASCEKHCTRMRITVSYAMVQTKHLSNGVKVSFGEGILAPADPLFADPETGDFHLRSAFGRWTAAGYVSDPVTSPALAKGTPGAGADNPERAGRRHELGAYGNSGEASYVR